MSKFVTLRHPSELLPHKIREPADFSTAFQGMKWNRLTHLWDVTLHSQWWPQIHRCCLEAPIDASVHLCLLITFSQYSVQWKPREMLISVYKYRTLWGSMKAQRGWRGERHVQHKGDAREKKGRRKCSDRQRRGSAIKGTVTQACVKSLRRLCAQGSVCWHATLCS